MSYFKPYIDDTGLHVPTYADVLDYIITQYQSVFGVDIYLGEDSPDYQIISIFAKAWDDLNAVTQDSYNAINPDWAAGASLDHLAALNGVHRKPAEPSTVVLDLTGYAGTIIPAGVCAVDVKGYVWATTEDVMLDDMGHASVNAVCLTAGAIIAEGNTINSIVTPVAGWTSVNNPLPCSVGRDVETDIDFRARRLRAVAQPTRTVTEGIAAAIDGLPGLERPTQIYENVTNMMDERGIPGHSFCCVVYGEQDDDEVAKAIWLRKPPGVGTHGNTEVLHDGNVIKFSRPDPHRAKITIKMVKLPNFDNVNTPIEICKAISDYVNGISNDIVVPYLYSVAYGSQTGAPTFVITGMTIDIDRNGEHTQYTDKASILYDEMLVCEYSLDNENSDVTIQYVEV